MSSESLSWLQTGRGRPPRSRWTYTTEAPLTGLKHSRESGQTVAADQTGGVYRIDRNGKLASVTRGFIALNHIASDDVGRRAAVVDEQTRLSFFDEKLRVVWSLELSDAVTALDVEPHGRYVAVALANGKNVVYDAHHLRVFHFETPRPLRHLRFLALRPALVAAAEYGLLCEFDFSGKCVWTAKLPINVGDVTSTGDGGRISLAAFSQGVRHVNGSGEPDGSYLLEGTPNRLSTSIVPFRLAVTTLEGHLYWLDESGEFVWGAALPEDAFAIHTEPLGNGLVCGFQSGRIVSLAWN
jgi:hypothetical protein